MLRRGMKPRKNSNERSRSASEIVSSMDETVIALVRLLARQAAREHLAATSSNINKDTSNDDD